MELVLIRHGQAQAVEHDPTGADPSLSELGRRQAAAMADYVKAHLDGGGLDAVWSSPMRRAQETAGLLCEAIGGEPRLDERLAEFDLGHTSYRPPDPGVSFSPEVRDRALAAMREPAFVRRVAEGIDAVVEANPGGRVAVVCHFAVIMHAVGHLTGFDGLLERGRADYASVSRMLVSRGGHVTIDRLNDTPWLRVGGSDG